MSLAKVARDAGVAVSTVSRYVRGELKVSTGTASRIHAALVAGGYDTPKSVRSSEEACLGLIVPSLDNPYFAVLADAVTDAAAESGTEVLTVLTGSAAFREQAGVDRLINLPNVAGLIYLGMNGTNEAFASQVAGNYPVVFLDEYVATAGPRASHVTADSFGGAFQATSHLISLGHRKIAHLGGPENLLTAEQREAGYRAALEAHDISVEENAVVRGEFTAAFGSNFFAHMAKSEVQPTAVFSASDIAAVGMFESARRAGIAIPGDLSVVGCDGITLGEWITPRLTTVSQPTAGMAHRAVDEILRLIAGKRPEDHILPMSLTVRESTRKL